MIQDNYMVVNMKKQFINISIQFYKYLLNKKIFLFNKLHDLNNVYNVNNFIMLIIT